MAHGRPLALRFVMSAPQVDGLPESSAEVAVAGRSNVGKSSLINAVAGRKRIAEVSKTPGRTQLLNLFELEGVNASEGRLGATLVDLPGYGYAKVPVAVKDTWGPMIEAYLTRREPLRMILVLVDGEVGPTKLDLAMLEWLAFNDLAHSVIATKHDKVKPSAREKRKRELAERCGLQRGDVLWVSAAKGVNVDTLRSRIRHWLTEA